MKQLKLIYKEPRPVGAPIRVWVPDALGLEELALRFPGSVGFVDLERGDIGVHADVLDDPAVVAQLRSDEPSGTA